MAPRLPHQPWPIANAHVYALGEALQGAVCAGGIAETFPRGDPDAPSPMRAVRCLSARESVSKSKEKSHRACIGSRRAGANAKASEGVSAAAATSVPLASPVPSRLFLALRKLDPVSSAATCVGATPLLTLEREGSMVGGRGSINHLSLSAPAALLQEPRCLFLGVNGVRETSWDGAETEGAPRSAAQPRALAPAWLAENPCLRPQLAKQRYG